MLFSCPPWKQHDDAMWHCHYPGVAPITSRWCACKGCKAVVNSLWSRLLSSGLLADWDMELAGDDMKSAMAAIARVLRVVLGGEVWDHDGIVREEYAFVGKPTDLQAGEELLVQVSMEAPLLMAPVVKFLEHPRFLLWLVVDFGKKLEDALNAPRQTAHKMRVAGQAKETVVTKTSRLTTLPPMVTLCFNEALEEDIYDTVQIPQEFWCADTPEGAVKVSYQELPAPSRHYTLSAVVMASTPPVELKTFKRTTLAPGPVAPWLCHHDDGTVRPVGEVEATTFIPAEYQPCLLVFAHDTRWAQ